MLQTRTLSSLLLLLAGAWLTACDLEKEVNLDLPEFQSELVVECYLEAGKPYQLTVTESSSYFDRPEPILVPDATVIITHNGKADTLQYRPFYERETGKFYTHFLDKQVQGNVGDAYSLEVRDTRGRHATGFTRFLPKVTIDTIEYRTNDQNKVRLATTFTDRPEFGNKYRYTIHIDSLSTRKRINDYFRTDRLNNGEKIQFGTTYRFAPHDTLFVTLYHLEQQYYDFLNTVDDAQDANGNPFAQPSAVKSTVQGGLGVFTTLVYDRRTVILK